MTTSAEALVWLLQNDPTLGTVLAQRVFPLAAPEGTPLPALAYQQISDDPVMSHDGFSGQQTTRYQLTLNAATYPQVRKLARALKRLLSGYRGTVGDLTIGYCKVEDDLDDYMPLSVTGSGLTPGAHVDVLMTHDEH